METYEEIYNQLCVARAERKVTAMNNGIFETNVPDGDQYRILQKCVLRK